MSPQLGGVVYGPLFWVPFFPLPPPIMKPEPPSPPYEIPMSPPCKFCVKETANLCVYDRKFPEPIAYVVQFRGPDFLCYAPKEKK